MTTIAQNILEAIGNTPITRINKIAKDSPAEIYAKLEFLNPGGSIKDRIGYWLIEDAEKKGRLRPGGTIVEGTSGNTGVGLAIAAAIKGYQCIFVLPDKMSMEKIRNLRAFGAKVVVTPTAVAPEDPRSYYSVSKRLAQETPNSVYIDQYNNLGNRECHYQKTGPEILKQFPDVDVIVAGIGTGGTVCGIGRYIKEKKPSVKIIAVDPIGSIVFDKYKHGKIIEARAYKIEGIGEDFFPANYDFKVIDDMVQVDDKESFLMTRELLTKEGIYSGISSGAAVVGALRYAQSQGNSLKGKKILVILPDSGNRYLSKVYDDNWMREAGFLEKSNMGTLRDVIESMKLKAQPVHMCQAHDKISTVIELLTKHGISQLPVSDTSQWIKGIVNETSLLNALYTGQLRPSDTIEPLINPAIEFLDEKDSVESSLKVLTQGKTLLIKDAHVEGKIKAILTKIDLLGYLGKQL